jgi:hypothetical protein
MKILPSEEVIETLLSHNPIHTTELVLDDLEIPTLSVLVHSSLGTNSLDNFINLYHLSLENCGLSLEHDDPDNDNNPSDNDNNSNDNSNNNWIFPSLGKLKRVRRMEEYVGVLEYILSSQIHSFIL